MYRSKRGNIMEKLIKLNSLYTELEYEKDKKTIEKIKRNIKKIEKELEEGVK